MDDEMWDEAHDATSGNMMWLPETETNEAIRAQFEMPEACIFRSFFDFDLASIPGGASIVSCTFEVKSSGGNICIASIQKGTQSDALEFDDYDAFSGAPFGTLTWAAGINVFVLNAAGLAYIESKFGDTAKLCMREYTHDYLDAIPGDGEDHKAGLYWSGAAGANRPKMTIKYTS